MIIGAADPPWPHGLPDFVLVFLNRNFIHTRQLEACFDDELTCQNLVTSGFPDMVPEEVANIVGSLMFWKVDNARAFKRSRIGVACEKLSGIPISVNNAFQLQDEYRQIISPSAVCLLEGHAKRRHLLFKGEPADIRSKRFERDRKKFALFLGNCIREADLPVASQISMLDDPLEGWLRILDDFCNKACQYFEVKVEDLEAIQGLA